MKRTLSWIDINSLPGENPDVFEVKPYVTRNGQAPFPQWHGEMKDHKAKIAIARRLYRMAQGNFGDCKPCQDGVWEMRIDLGPGYRVYYARAGNTIVLLLYGGNKRTQQADIAKACDYWKDWQSRHPETENPT